MKSGNYILYSGSINNAGDYLINLRAKSILEKHKPEKLLHEISRFSTLTASDYDLINSSDLLLLSGGPALKPDSINKVFKNINFELIRVPITTFGVGLKSENFTYQHLSKLKMNSLTYSLFERINGNPFPGSVRDYLGLDFLANHNLSNFSMTGCPAYYGDLSENQKIFFKPDDKIKSVAFSVGIGFATSKSLYQQTIQIIDYLASSYPNLKIIFHHSLDATNLAVAYGHTMNSYHRAATRLVRWLEIRGITYVDVSNSAQALINEYSSVDLHVGYRVHAHIYMTSIFKRSLLIAEDSRGIGSYTAVSGMVLESIFDKNTSLIAKTLKKLCPNLDLFTINPLLLNQVKSTLKREHSSNYLMSRNSFMATTNNKKEMERFVSLLP